VQPAQRKQSLACSAIDVVVNKVHPSKPPRTRPCSKVTWLDTRFVTQSGRQIVAAERPAADFRDHGVLDAVRDVVSINPVLVDLVVSNDSPTSAQSAAVAGAEMLFENGLISYAQFEDLLRGAAANFPTTFAPVSDSF
jgi:hypothetical protein